MAIQRVFACLSANDSTDWIGLGLQGSVLVLAQPIRDIVTLQRCLSLAGWVPRLTPGLLNEPNPIQSLLSLAAGLTKTLCMATSQLQHSLHTSWLTHWRQRAIDATAHTEGEAPWCRNSSALAMELRHYGTQLGALVTFVHNNLSLTFWTAGTITWSYTFLCRVNSKDPPTSITFRLVASSRYGFICPARLE